MGCYVSARVELLCVAPGGDAASHHYPFKGNLTEEADMAETIIVNLREALAAAEGGWDDPMRRYNGGWTKTVTDLDKSKDNGYSIVGEFVRKETVQSTLR